MSFLNSNTTGRSTANRTSFSNNDDDTQNSNREVCKYFKLGVCRYGDNCFYSHEPTEQDRSTTPTLSSSSSSSNTICKYFQLGRCMFGDNCFNQHILPSNTSTFSTEQQASSSSESSTSTSSPNNQIDNSNLVKRVTNKPKLLLTANLSSDETPESVDNEHPNEYSPISYYEALTGKRLTNDQDFNDLDLSMFDENYIDYMKRKRLIAQDMASTQAQLCPYFEKQLDCPFGHTCEYIHGDVCDLCNMGCLNPYDERQRDEHRKECMRYFEKDMEEAFAIQRSSEKPCGICMETVWEKEKLSERRFGILENCNHCYCLECIRKWRSSKSYENKIVKACPECRVKSDYVTPSKFWFENEDNKKKIIEEYKNRLGKTACKYFKQGDGTCPFGNKCFYLHQYKDGRIAQLPEPVKRRRFNRDGDLETYSNMVRIDLNYSDDEDDDELDLMFFLRSNLIGDTDTESDFSDFLELSTEFLNLF